MSVFLRHQDRRRQSTGKAGRSISDRATIMHRLRCQALAHTGSHWLLMIVAFAGFASIWPIGTALRWLGLTTIVLAYVHLAFWRRLTQNHAPPAGPLCPSLGVANGITLARGWAIGNLAGLIGAPVAHWMEWLPGLLYLGIAVADYVDGLWARRTRTETLLGQHLDMQMDALGLLIASLLAIALGRLPVVYVVVGLSYYVFHGGCWFRRHEGKPLRALRERPFGRFTAGLQMGFVGVALLPLFSARVLGFAALFVMPPLVLGFIWDWLVVSGRLSPATDHRVQRDLSAAASHLAAGLRLLLFIGGPVLIAVRHPTLPSGALALTLWIMLVVGFLGRSAALAASLLLASCASVSFCPLFRLALGALLVVLIVGTGRWSWWRPEDAFLARKAGKPR